MGNDESRVYSMLAGGNNGSCKSKHKMQKRKRDQEQIQEQNTFNSSWNEKKRLCHNHYSPRDRAVLDYAAKSLDECMWRRDGQRWGKVTRSQIAMRAPSRKRTWRNKWGIMRRYGERRRGEAWVEIMHDATARRNLLGLGWQRCSSWAGVRWAAAEDFRGHHCLVEGCTGVLKSLAW